MDNSRYKFTVKMTKIKPNYSYLTYSFLIIAVMVLSFNIMTGMEYNKSLEANLMDTKHQIEKEAAEREVCLKSLEIRNFEVAEKDKEVLELTKKAMALEEIKEKAIIEAKKLRQKLELLEKEKVKKVPERQIKPKLNP